MKKLKIIFMGTPSFAVPILEGLIENYDVRLVVCQPDRCKNRKGMVVMSPVKELALACGIAVFQPVKLSEEVSYILNTPCDMIITAAYGQILPSGILNYPLYGCINVHGSLLPKLRGGAPIHHAIINGDKETGVTIMRTSVGMDAGDIISQEKIAIEDDMILDTLYKRMSYLGRDLLMKTIPSIVDGSCIYRKQDEDCATYGFNITKEEMRISFERPALDIYNLIRGLNSSPLAYCFMNGKRMKVYRSEVVDRRVEKSFKYGEIVAVEKDGFIVYCLDSYLKIVEIAIEGKKRCMVRDYLNGVNGASLIGQVLE